MQERFPIQNGPEEVHRSQEVPLPENLPHGTYYFQVVKDRDIYRVHLIIKQEQGIIGMLKHDYGAESFVDRDKAIERADELTESPSSVHWSERK